jgi:hypothetical protein
MFGRLAAMSLNTWREHLLEVATSTRARSFFEFTTLMVVLWYEL